MKNLIIVLVLCVIAYAVWRAVAESKREGSESKSVRALPATVQHALANMPASAQAAFFAEYDRKKNTAR